MSFPQAVVLTVAPQPGSSEDSPPLVFCLAAAASSPVATFLCSVLVDPQESVCISASPPWDSWWSITQWPLTCCPDSGLFSAYALLSRAVTVGDGL